MEIVFADDDLARVRVWTNLDVMGEMVAASHRWRPPHRIDVMGGWARQTMTDLGPRAAPVLRDLRSGTFQSIGLGLGIFPDRSFEKLIDGSLARPTRNWRELIAVHRSNVPFPIDEALAEGRPAALNAAAESLRTFHRVALMPYWDQLNAMAGVFATGWATTLATRGIEALFNELHPTVSWQPPNLTLSQPGTKLCAPSCVHHVTDLNEIATRRSPISRRGLTILPTVFGAACGTWGDLDPVRGWAVYHLTVPVPVSWEWFESSTTSASDALENLLGPTRSWVLQACLDGSPSTTTLARNVGISVSSASEHATVLRTAGLLRAERHGNSVVHRVTAMGTALITSTNQARRPSPQVTRFAS